MARLAYPTVDVVWDEPKFRGRLCVILNGPDKKDGRHVLAFGLFEKETLTVNGVEYDSVSLSYTLRPPGTPLAPQPQLTYQYIRRGWSSPTDKAMGAILARVRAWIEEFQAERVNAEKFARAEFASHWNACERVRGEIEEKKKELDALWSTERQLQVQLSQYPTEWYEEAVRKSAEDDV
jgi:hypothetical protein